VFRRDSIRTLPRAFSWLIAVNLLAAIGWAQTTPPKSPVVKDQGEYDLAQALQKETDPQKKLDLLRQWEQKYPSSDFSSQRTLLEAQTNEQIAMAGYGKTDAAMLDASLKAAHDILDNLSRYFDQGVKPAGVSDADWQKARQTFELQANTVVGWVAMIRKDDAAAEAAFRRVLQLDPNAAQVSYFLGTVIYRQRNEARIPEALYQFARALAVTGTEALAPAGRKTDEDFLAKAFASYHGDNSGLEDVKKAAQKAALMPPDFTIESITEIQKRQEGDAAAFAAAHPDLALWRQIRDALKAAEGDAYFANIKGAGVPPQGDNATFRMFTGKVVSQPSPKELVVSVDTPVGDAALLFDMPLRGTIEPGTEIRFKGVVDSYVKDPYLLMLTGLDKNDVEGLPASAFGKALARPRPAAKKK
jgi:tetratricopeptide (TPR) repeat protein